MPLEPRKEGLEIEMQDESGKVSSGGKCSTIRECPAALGIAGTEMRETPSLEHQPLLIHILGFSLLTCLRGHEPLASPHVASSAWTPTSFT